MNEIKAPAPLVATGGRAKAIIPQDARQAWQMAEMAVEAKWVDCDTKAAFAAIIHGQELGLGPMMSLQRIKIINGHPSVYGDAVPALALSTGQMVDWKERIEGTGDNMEAVCEVRRRGLESAIVGRFSVEDAKTANLWGKNVWRQYPKRMLMMRARGYAFRDAFADKFAGLMLAEEAQDLPKHTWETVDNPLGDNPQVVNAERQPRQDVREARREAVQETIDPDTGEVTTAQETAPATSPEAAQAYLAEALTRIINALDVAELGRWWRAELGPRLAAGLTEHETAQLVEAYDARCASLQGEGS